MGQWTARGFLFYVPITNNVHDYVSINVLRWFVRARREGVFLDRPQVCVLVVVVRIKSERDPRKITVDEKSPVSGGSILGKSCGSCRTLDVIVRLIACDVSVVILTMSHACGTTKVVFQFVLVVGRRSWAVPLTVILSLQYGTGSWPWG